jgi:hypothetical protein
VLRNPPPQHDNRGEEKKKRDRRCVRTASGEDTENVV